MKVLVSSINFHPDHSGIALYATDLPVFLAEKGNEVTMVTGFPYYPGWQKRREDRRRLFRQETFKGVNVLRGYLFVPKRLSVVARMLHEASFVLSAFFGFARAGRQDAIVILSPPLLLCLVGLFFKVLWKSHLVLNVQDIQPDAALSLGMIRDSPMTKVLLWLERFCYRHSSHVVTISERMRVRLLSKGVPAEKVSVCYNWIDVRSAARRRPPRRFLASHPELAEKFLVAYAGNIGAKQGLESLVGLAAMMRARTDVHFLIIGEGAEKAALQESARRRELTNLTFLPLLGPEPYREMLADVDVVYVGQRAGTGDVFFPSKLLGIMAMSKPLLVSADPDSELASFVADRRCGLVADAGDPQGLAAELEALMADGSLREELGRRAENVVWTFDREAVLERFLRELEIRMTELSSTRAASSEDAATGLDERSPSLSMNTHRDRDR